MEITPTVLLINVAVPTNEKVGDYVQSNSSKENCLEQSARRRYMCSHSDLTKVLAGLQAVGGAVSRPVDELILENNYLPSLPGGAFSSLRVSRLMLRDNGLERVASSWLAGLEDSLLELFVVEPKLRSLPVDCLEQLRGLEAITIQGGAMKRIPRLSGLRRLRYVQIKSPSLVELSPHGFKSLPDLEQLHVVHSPHLTRLEAGLFQDMNRLRLVNISHCGLTWLHPRAMARLPVLTELALRGNRLMDAGMVSRSVRDLPALSTLRLDDNLIERLGEASFVDLPALREVHITGNRILDIHRGAFHRYRGDRCSQKQRAGLDLSYNDLQRLDARLLANLPSLRRLDVSGNVLSMVDPATFLPTPALEHVNLSGNALTSFHPATFRHLLNLYELDLGWNRMREIVPGLPRGIEYLHMARNQVRDRVPSHGSQPGER
uniref:Uncharacterized protein n=1 Tax=Timema monikensis TaxID=170555 RepID=A0A7R9E5R0_9NEOP|nr:unnamed protein product [Timema monikensis]